MLDTFEQGHKPNLIRDFIERRSTALESKSSTSKRLGVEARPTLKRVRANMKLTGVAPGKG